MIDALKSRRLGFPTGIFAFLLAAAIVLCDRAAATEMRTPPGARDNSAAAAPAGPMPPVIVFGFLGGLVRHDDPVHDEVRLAARLRKAYPSGVDVETFENYHGENARKKILALLDANHDGTLTQGEKQNARIILYGHSWGASEAITVARELESDGVPVLLTIQVDSVSKFRQNDSIIPANVARAANFYQPDGFIHGQAEIRAADPSRTKIIGNFKFDYKASPYNCKEYPWFDRLLVKSHTQIECDPSVWGEAEALIRSDLPMTAGSSSEK
jgi:hypothetical protein